jgi:hypothetical protein
MEIVDWWRKRPKPKFLYEMTIRVCALVLLVMLPLAAHAADMDGCSSYATQTSAAALRRLLGVPWVDVAAGRFLYRKAYTYCLNADEVPPLVFSPEQQPIVDGLPTPAPRPEPPPAAAPAAAPAATAPKGQPQPLCVRYGKRTVYNGKQWRCK